jgi:hypothetical protein
MGRLHQEFGCGGKGRGWKGYRRLVGVGRERDGKAKLGDCVAWEGKRTGRLHQEIGFGGKGKEWVGKATSGDWEGWGGKGIGRLHQ